MQPFLRLVRINLANVSKMLAAIGFGHLCYFNIVTDLGPLKAYFHQS
jgi:hypothetical protein